MMMMHRLQVCWLFAVAMELFFSSFVQGGHGRGAKVFGYFPEWRQRFFDEDHAHRLRDICAPLTHLILFSLEVGANGDLSGLDRMPSSDRLARIKRECQGVRILLCLGGNSRSGAFSSVSRTRGLRQRFAGKLCDFLSLHGLDGVDWNWEYPSGKEDWEGLVALVGETRSACGKVNGFEMTMAYYPDGQQERVLKALKFDEHVDWLHSMAYDAPGKHSTMELAQQTVDNINKSGLDSSRMTLGLPMYARDTKTGEWKTFHDVAAEAGGASRLSESDSFGNWYYNSPKTIAAKVRLALGSGLGGVMIWESGQDTVDALLHGALGRALDAQGSSTRDEL